MTSRIQLRELYERWKRGEDALAVREHRQSKNTLGSTNVRSKL
jgi:hypothetical protein